jgi:hypothetical protein
VERNLTKSTQMKLPMIGLIFEIRPSPKAESLTALFDGPVSRSQQSIYPTCS